METYRDRVKSIRPHLRKRMTSTPADGLLLAAFRLFFGSFLLVWTRAVFVPLLLLLDRPAEWLAKRMTPSPTAQDIYWLGIDLYKLLLTILTLASYCTVMAVRDVEAYRAVVSCVVGVLAIVRLVEFVAAVGLLFFGRPSESAAESFRPLANALWSYFEVAILFGILFAALSAFEPGAIQSSDESVTRTFIGPLYFSFITLATVGYGDLTPRTGFARTLVMFEIGIGLFLTVAIIQKALTRIPASIGIERSDKMASK